jgi:hypothetical protein
MHVLVELAVMVLLFFATLIPNNKITDCDCSVLSIHLYNAAEPIIATISFGAEVVGE